MEQRTLGGSGLYIPALILGTATFGGGNEFFKKWGDTGVIFLCAGWAADWEVVR